MLSTNYELENISHSGLVLCVCLGLVHMHICIKYEGSENCSTTLLLLILRGVTAVKNLKKHQVLGEGVVVCSQCSQESEAQQLQSKF